MNMVQQSFLAWLHEQRYHQRMTNYEVYDAYYNGDHEVDIPKKVQAALESELGTINNYCRVVVDTPVDYICGTQIGIEVSPIADTEEGGSEEASTAAEEFLYGVYEDNNLLYEEMLKTITLMGKKGDVFLKLYLEDEEIKIRVLRPDICYPRYKSDDYAEMLHCAVKWYDETEDGGIWKAEVFRPDVVEYYELGEDESETSLWTLVAIEDNPLGFIPVVHIKNTIDDLEFGVSDLQVMTDLQDALNKTLTDMMMTMDMQAFQRIVVIGSQKPPGASTAVGPSEVMYVPSELGSVEVIEASDISPFIAALKEIVDQICTITSIPKVAFSKSEGGPISGYALRVHYIPLERKSSKKQVILVNRFKELNDMIFKAATLLGKGDFSNFKGIIHFDSGLPIDDEAEMAIHEMELLNKIKSRRTVMEERGIEDVDAELERIKEDETSDYQTGTRAARERGETESALEQFTNRLTTEPKPEEVEEE